MGVFYEKIPDSLIKWALEQHLFYVSTAPLSNTGHVNVSPKGGKYFGITSHTEFWFLDLTGSGSETIAHLHEPGNGRITIMFNAFDGAPKIVRFWGKGEVLEYGTNEYEQYVKDHNVATIPGTRAIIVVHIHQVGSSCGFSVPKFEFQEYRTQLNEFAAKRVSNEESGNHKDGIERYWAFKNSYSVDGIPSLKRGLKTHKAEAVAPLKKMVGPYGEAISRTQETKKYTRTVTIPAFSLIAAILLSFFVGIAATVLLQGEFALRRDIYKA